jgi:hypothetical protein
MSAIGRAYAASSRLVGRGGLRAVIRSRRVALEAQRRDTNIVLVAANAIRPVGRDAYFPVGALDVPGPAPGIISGAVAVQNAVVDESRERRAVASRGLHPPGADSAADGPRLRGSRRNLDTPIVPIRGEADGRREESRDGDDDENLDKSDASRGRAGRTPSTTNQHARLRATLVPLAMTAKRHAPRERRLFRSDNLTSDELVLSRTRRIGMSSKPFFALRLARRQRGSPSWDP